MPEPYVGEIRMFAGNFAPVAWALCQGQAVPLSDPDYQPLFQLIGTTYGGDGETTFNLPNLASRVPIHMGTGPDGTTYPLGRSAGTEAETLDVPHMPNHTHPLLGTGTLATLNLPTNNVLAASNGATLFPYGTDEPTTTLNAASVGPVGGGQPHDNTQPFLCINFIISLYGIYPHPS